MAAASVTAGVVEAGGQLLSALSERKVDLSIQDTGKVEWRTVAINSLGNSLGAALADEYKQYQGEQLRREQESNDTSDQITARKARETLAVMQGAQALRTRYEHSADGLEKTELPDPIERLLNKLSPASKLDSMIQLVGKGRASARYTQSARLNREDIIPVAQNARVREVLNLAEDGFGHVQQLGSLVDDIRSARAWPELMDGRVQKVFEEMKQNGFTGTIRDSKETARDPFADRRVSTAIDRIENLKVDYINQLEDQRMTRTWGPNYKLDRYGHSKMTAFELEQKVFDVQQRAVDDSYQRYIAKLDTKTPFNPTAAGNFVDLTTRTALLEFYRREGLAIGTMTVNKRFYGAQSYTIPDNLLGTNLVYETTLAAKGPDTLQLQKMFAADPTVSILVIRPTTQRIPWLDNQLDALKESGSYLVRRGAIQQAMMKKSGG